MIQERPTATLRVSDPEPRRTSPTGATSPIIRVTTIRVASSAALSLDPNLRMRPTDYFTLERKFRASLQAQQKAS